MPSQPPKDFSSKLLRWYRKNARKLPWRDAKDPYRIWISEVMLQQTTVATVIPYYHKWLKVFPDIRTLASANQEKVLKTWQGLGYYQRARNLHKAARLIVEDHAGRIPSDKETLRRLPGFGPYTTAAVLSIAFNKPEPLVDANVRRVMMRILALEGEAKPDKDGPILKFLEKVFSKRRPGDFNQALMELGALVCRSREPVCNVCPLETRCAGYRKGVQELIPTPRRRSLKDVHAVIAVIRNKDFYLIQKRPPKGLFADLWEFPGGKIEKGETPKKALRRELKEELGAELRSARYLFQVKQFYTQFRAHLDVWECVLKTDPSVGPTRKWVRARSLSRYPMPSGSARILDKLFP